MIKLTSKQQISLDRVFSARLSSEISKALELFEKTLPQRSQGKREEIADLLITKLETATEHPTKKHGRLLAALARIDTPNAAEVVANYANGDPDRLDDRIQVSALTSLLKMTSYDGKCALLQDMLARDNVNNRIKALVLRQLIQCNEDDSNIQNEYVDQLMAMGRNGNADHKWAAIRALRTSKEDGSLPAFIEQRFITELVALTLKDNFEWQDVQIQAALVLGDVQHQLTEAMVQLSIASKSASTSVLKRYCIRAMRDVAQRMDKGQRDGSSFNTILLATLDDKNPDVRSCAYTSLRKVLKPQATIKLITDSLLQQEELSAGQLEALRNIDEKGASKILREHLLHPDPEIARRASTALTHLGGHEAFSILFSQRRQAIEKYTKILNDADEKIMEQYNALMRQARGAFWISMSMHTLVFLVGIVMLVRIFYFAQQGFIAGSSDIMPILQGLFGTTGGIIAIYFGLFYKDPINNIGKSVTRLVKINVAFLGYMRQINQIDATFKQLFLDTSGFTLNEMKETVNQIQIVVDQSLEKIQTYLPSDVSPISNNLENVAKKGMNAVSSQVRKN